MEDKRAAEQMLACSDCALVGIDISEVSQPFESSEPVSTTLRVLRATHRPERNHSGGAPTGGKHNSQTLMPKSVQINRLLRILFRHKMALGDPSAGPN